jgi:hypothetical protein
VGLFSHSSLNPNPMPGADFSQALAEKTGHIVQQPSQPPAEQTQQLQQHPTEQMQQLRQPPTEQMQQFRQPPAEQAQQPEAAERQNSTAAGGTENEQQQ